MFEREGTFVVVKTHSHSPSHSLTGTGLLSAMPSMVRMWEGRQACQDKTTKTVEIVQRSFNSSLPEPHVCALPCNVEGVSLP